MKPSRWNCTWNANQCLHYSELKSQWWTLLSFALPYQMLAMIFIKPFRLEKMFKITGTNHQSDLPSPVTGHVPQCHTHTFSEYSRPGYSTISLDNLFWCLTTLSLRNIAIIANLNLPSCNLRTFCHFLSLVAPEKRDWHLPHSNLLSDSCRKQLLSILFYKLNLVSSATRSYLLFFVPSPALLLSAQVWETQYPSRTWAQIWM